MAQGALIVHGKWSIAAMGGSKSSFMKINSDDKLSFVSFNLRSRDSRDEKILGWSVISLEIEVSCGGFTGRDEDVTFRDDQIKAFLSDVRRLEKNAEALLPWPAWMPRAAIPNSKWNSPRSMHRVI